MLRFRILRSGRLHLLVVAALLAVSVSAATITVTNNNDSGAGSLRQATVDAVSGDTIVFGLTGGHETITLGSELSISGKSLTIDGSNTAGSGTAVTVQVATPGTSNYRVFTLSPGSGNTVALSLLTLRGGDVGGSRGGVVACGSGNTTLTGVTLKDGRAGNGGGLNVEMLASVALTNTTVSGNTALSFGGGLHVNGDATLTNTTVRGNRALIFGGGLFLESGDVALTNTTVSANTANMRGGGLYVNASGSAKLLNTVAIDNTASDGGADLYIFTGAIAGTISAYGSWYDGTFGTITTVATAPNVTTTYTAGDLGALANNGGVTPTMALARSAPAVGSGLLAHYNATDGYYFQVSAGGSYYKLSAPNTAFSPNAPAADLISADQRGVKRSAPADMGAFQMLRVASQSVPAAGSYAAGDTLDFTATFGDTVTVGTASGSPRLALTIGATTRYATCVSGSGTAALVFRYTVQAGDTDTDGIAVASTAIDLNSGSIVDRVGFAVGLTLSSYTLPTILVDTTTPTVPTTLAASATSSTAIALSWTASTDLIGVVGYRIYRAGTAIGTSTTTSYAATGLTSATSYSFTVTAYDAAGNESAASAAANATTQTSGAQLLAVANTDQLAAALATAAANPSATYTITLSAGTYAPTSGLTISTSGVTLRSSGRAILSGAGVGSGALLTISGDNVIVFDLDFENATLAVSITAGADNGALTDCDFTNAGLTGSGCRGWALTGNSFRGVSGDALNFTASDGLTLTDNVILDCARAFVLVSSSGPKVRNNFIANNSANNATPSIVLTDVTSAQIDNNSVYQAGIAANAIEYSGSAAIGAIRNNLANKLIVATGSATATLATNCTDATASWFAAPTSGDLHLVATRSAVVDVGTTLGDLTVDIDGDLRPTGRAYDIGADEFQPDTVAPSAPTGVNATVSSATRIALSWTASTDTASNGVTATGVSGYRIYRNGAAIGTSTITSYADTGLTAGTTYSYTVTAYDGAANESAASSSVSATTTTASTSDSGGGGACGLLLPAALALLVLRRCRLCRR